MGACRRYLVGLVLSVAAACGSDSGAEPDAASPADIALGGACALDVSLGGFTVAVGPGESLVSGVVEDSVLPIRVLEEIAADESCRLLRRNVPFCDPSCQPGEACDFDGMCIAQPEPQDIGVATIHGLEDEVVMEPIAPGNNYSYTIASHPLYMPGLVAHLVSTEGAYGELSMHGVGSEPFTSGGDLSINSGQDLELSWSAPTASEVYTEMHIELAIDQHGASPLRLVCEFADTGSGTVSAALIDGLFDAGVSGFPSGSMARRTVDSQMVAAGCIDFRMETTLPAMILVENHTPCRTPLDPCPDGQTCDLGTQTCRDEL